MKNNLVFFIFLVIDVISIKGQNNLIPNAGFENAKSGQQPQCEYAVNANLPIKIKLR